jgi:hypothetical protein
MRDITIFFVLTEDIYVNDFLASINNQSYNKDDIHLFADISKMAIGSAVSRSALFTSFSATMAESDFPHPYTIGYGSTSIQGNVG